jgi:hypothetical protein
MRKLSFAVLACLMASPLVARVPNPAPSEPRAEAIVGCRETKLYHRPTCKWVKQIDKAGTRVDFKSAAEAKKAGMRPCRDCKPGE